MSHPGRKRTLAQEEGQCSCYTILGFGRSIGVRKGCFQPQATQLLQLLANRG